jgi:hypothetical protein
MEDCPREPLYNPIKNNLIIDCKKEICSFDKNVMDLMDKFEIETNLVIFTASTNKIPLKAGVHGFTTLNGSAAEPVDLGFKDVDAGNFNLRWFAKLPKIAPDFKEIPFSKIGLYEDDFRKKLPQK